MVDAPWASRLQDLADLTTPMTLRVAATLRLADHLADGVSGIDELARRTGTHARSLHRVLRHLVAMNVFTEPSPGSFELADLGKELCDHGPGDARTWLDLGTAVGRVDLALTNLLDVVRTGEPAPGENTWSALDADRALSDSFDDQMASGAAAKAPGLAAGYDWGTVERVVDVGGGNGTLLTALLLAHPHLRGTVVDRDGPIDNARRKFDGAGLTARASGAAQSFFDPLPAGADVYVICGVLHDWDDEHAGRILARAAEAAGSHGRVLVLESLLEPSSARSSTTDMDLLMMVTTGGRARPFEDMVALGAAAGLKVLSRKALTAPHTLIEFAAR
ncbi:O-methyltransferase [Amycolatopsis xylanica]|uniref:O-methyltransferase n=1 Tax=Amycolatopsis xylanica TaxID=589385 RepID=A0A1H2VR23_9PSEU|nr:methyltransferase [Amycolatopsis xylanica]SDW70862.1 O-methyltransferase [Amycolatopsis xylanica]